MINLFFKFLICTISIGSIYYIYTAVDWGRLLEILAHANLFMISLMMLSWIFLLILRPFRLSILFSSINHNNDINYLKILTANLIATALNNVLPAKVGDLYIPLILRKKSFQARKSIPVLVIEKIIDLMLILFLFLFSIFFSPVLPVWAKSLSELGIVILIFSSLFFVLIVRKKSLVFRLSKKFFYFLPSRWIEFFIKVLSDSLEALELLVKSKKIFLFVIISFVMSFITACFYYFGFLSLLGNSTLNAAIFTMSAVALSFLFPLTPGGIGIFHTVVVSSLFLFGVSFDKALAVAVLLHGLPFITITIVASFLILNIKFKFVSKVRVFFF